MTSDASFPFGGPEPQEAPETVEEGSRRLVAVGGLLGAVVLGAGGFFLLGGSGGDAQAASLAVPSSAAAVVPQAVAPAHVEVVPAATTEQVGRNPFKPRYVEPKEVPAAAAPATTADLPSTVPATVPLPLPIPQAPVQVVVQQPAEAKTPAEYPITFLGAAEEGGVQTWTWRVDGSKDTLTVLAGQRFGKYGELIVLMTVQGETGPEAVLQVGDSSPVRVKLNETIKVL